MASTLVGQICTSHCSSNEKKIESNLPMPQKIEYPTYLHHTFANKRLRSQSPLTHSENSLIPNSSRCGEIFVTNSADKWTFICSYCQEIITDIGVFICHIKLKHLGDHQLGKDFSQQTDSEQLETSENNDLNSEYAHSQPSAFISSTNILQRLPKVSEIMMVSSLVEQESTKSKDIISNKNSDGPNFSNVDALSNKNHLNIAQEQHSISTADTENKEMFEVSYFNEDNNKKDETSIIIDDDYEVSENCGNVITDNEGEDKFSYSLDDKVSNKNEDDLEFIYEANDDMRDSGLLCIQTSSRGADNDDVASSSSESKKARSTTNPVINYCNMCDKTFENQNVYRSHMKKHTDIAPHKCQYCNKSFKSKQAIYYHVKTHEKKKQYQCPLCPITHCTENLFISHVLTHENEGCFPCQVCGEVSLSKEDRTEHLKTHEAERPYGCSFCQRRFRKKHFLTNHLRLHCQYQCDFCPAEFNSTQAQRRPYVCPTCEKSADIKKKAEQQRSMLVKSHMFDSDQE